MTTTKKCILYHLISILTHVSKILIKNMARRMEIEIKAVLSDQFGFRKNTSIRKEILALKIVIEKIIRKDSHKTHRTFVDIEKTLENINWSVILKMLNRDVSCERCILYSKELLRCGITDKYSR